MLDFNRITHAVTQPAGALIPVLACLALQSPSLRAQGVSEGATAGGKLEEIVVTAQRREESAQDIPVALSVLGAQEIERLGVASIENVAPRVPSFYFGSFGALRPQLYIRGIGTRSFDPGSESSVGVFTDEVYLGRATGSFGALKDIERVEVLRGPQGTLYGRNTIGGAINVITKRPTPEFEAQAEAGIGNYGAYDLFGAVGGPVTNSKAVMFRAAGWHSRRDGYVKNLATGSTFQGVENDGGRLRLAIEPNDKVRVDLTAEYLKDGDEAAFGGFNQGTGPSITGAPANPNAVFFAPASRVPHTRQNLEENYLSSDPTLDRKASSYVARVEYDAAFATFTSISAFRKLEVEDGRDLEGSSLDVLQQNSDEDSDQFTQELRLTSNPDGMLSLGGKLDWIVGVFYYDDDSDRVDTFRVGVDSLTRAAAGTPAADVTLADYSMESVAAFGQATYHFGEKVDLTLGARYTRDKKKATQSGTTTDALPLIAAPFTTTNDAKYTSFDPRIVLSYKFTPEVNAYASFSTGFKSGGFQYNPFSAAQANVLFDPEDIKAYEVGFKSTLLGSTVRVNGAAFYYDYKDLQVSRIIDAGGAPVTLISNAASSEIKGVDLEVQARVIESVEVSLAYGYLDAKYDKYIFNITQNLDFSNTTMVRAPENTVNLGVEWSLPLGSDRLLSVRADYSWLDKFYHEPGEGDARFGSGIPLTVEDSYGLLDVRVAFEQGNWRLTGYMSNATDEEYRRTVNALGATVVGFAGQPRLYGFKVGYTF